jgi:hypothetical protein
LTLHGLEVGRWRELTRAEVGALRSGAKRHSSARENLSQPMAPLA